VQERVGSSVTAKMGGLASFREVALSSRIRLLVD
jgi:hypothetical protein